MKNPQLTFLKDQEQGMDVHLHHFYSIQYWKSKSEQLSKEKKSKASKLKRNKILCMNLQTEIPEDSTQKLNKQIQQSSKT